jgi:hypothetical protein
MTVNYRQLCDAFSSDRMSPYKDGNRSESQALAVYQNNILLCESLYPSLHLLEVLLRNRLEEALVNQHGDQWYSRPTFVESLHDDESRKLNEALQKLGKENLDRQRDGKPIKTVNSGRVVAQLSFGFWTGLLGTNYEQTLWVPNHKRIFPAALPSERNIKQIRLRINRVRLLRNRVMHHEPIWNHPALWDRYQDILDFIEWISPDALEWSQPFDRFPDTFASVFPRQEA